MTDGWCDALRLHAWERVTEMSSRRSVGRPSGLRPVIAGRVEASLHRKIAQMAEASGRSMSEELAELARQAIERRKPKDPEVSALTGCIELLDKLNRVQCRRVLDYLQSRYDEDQAMIRPPNSPDA